MILTAAEIAAGRNQFTDDMALVRQLYESAEYERALEATARMDSEALTDEQARDRTIYAALCLLALGRQDEAETRIEGLIRIDPLFMPPPDMPPRLKTIIDNVRRDLTPVLAREHYQAGKEEFDSKHFEAALKEFTLVVDLTRDAGETAAPITQDVRVLAAGFLDLARRALTPPAPASAASPAARAAQTAEAAIDPPVAIRQDLPPMPAAVAQMTRSRQPSMSGVLDVVIDAHGDVKSTRLVQRIHPQYDGLLLQAARKWKYRAATRNGEPIEYVKRLAITVDVRPPGSVEPSR